MKKLYPDGTVTVDSPLELLAIDTPVETTSCAILPNLLESVLRAMSVPLSLAVLPTLATSGQYMPLDPSMSYAS